MSITVEVTEPHIRIKMPTYTYAGNSYTPYDLTIVEARQLYKALGSALDKADEYF